MVKERVDCGKIGFRKDWVEERWIEENLVEERLDCGKIGLRKDWTEEILSEIRLG